VAVDYEEQLRESLAASPHDRAVLALFAELVTGRVVDVGCGPGRITRHLADLGVDVAGVDLSPGMVEVARSRHPGLDFSVGRLSDLALPDAALGCVVAWYSVIHTPPERQVEVFAELRRVLRPGGLLLLAFQVGEERRRLERPYGHDVVLDAYRLSPERVGVVLEQAGLPVTTSLVRGPLGGRETSPQCYLMCSAG
jgi:SAM-dependent methyltransferase